MGASICLLALWSVQVYMCNGRHFFVGSIVFWLVSSWGETKMSKSYELATADLEPVDKAVLSNSSRGIRSLLEPFLFTFLTFPRCTLPLSVFSCSLSVTFKPNDVHAVCFLLELFLLMLLLPSWPLAPGPYRYLLCLAGSQSCSSWRHTCCLIPSQTLPLLSIFVILSWACAPKLNHVFLSLHMPIMFHSVRQTNGHTDTRSDKLPLNI